ncbi:MAG: PD-(D/E)XK nuclease family protein, partial [Phycisphaerae bacterium]|nr:PD-(D/E)XK nuclease family protein [Phycisphaerae bacterium]
LEPFGGLARAEREKLIEIEKVSPGQFLPAPQQLTCPRDAFNTALAGLLGGEPADYKGALAWAARSQGEKIAQASMGLWARRRRWSEGQCDQFDGRITHPALLEVLAQRYPADVVFSASRLNVFGQCPWRHFATYVLKLAPLARPERQLEAVTRGRFVHDVLFRLFSRLRDEAGGPVRPADVDKDHLRGALDEAVAAEANCVQSGRQPYPALWEIQLAQMRDNLWAYLTDQHAGEKFDTESIYFELGFGMEEGEVKMADPASRSEPVVLETPAGPIRLRGKIDRVDSVRFEDAAGLMVVDYKTGSLPDSADIREGRNLQLPLYAEAVERLLKAASVGGAFHRIGPRNQNGQRFFAIGKKFGRQQLSAEQFNQARQEVLARVGQFISNMRRGRFDLAPTHECPGYCPYRQICHFAKARAELKSPADREGRT